MRLKLKLALIGGLALAALTTTSADSEVELGQWESRYAELEQKMRRLQNEFILLDKELGQLASRFYDIPGTCDGRLTTETGVPLSTSDRTAQTSIYFTPYKGNTCSVYDGSTWNAYSFSEAPKSLSGITSGNNYDVFGYMVGSTLTLELSAAWTDATSRADAVTLQNNIYVKSSATTRRLLGTIRASANNQTEDSKAKRFVWNYLHRLPRPMKAIDSTDTWTYNSTTWRQANAAAGNQLAYVVGENDRPVIVRAMSLQTNGTGKLNYGASGVGVDSTTVNSATIRGSGSYSTATLPTWSTYQGFPGLGYHYLVWLESGHASTLTFWGDNGSNATLLHQSGIIGVIDG